MLCCLLAYCLSKSMFSDNIAGSAIHDANPRFRMYLVVTVAVGALGSVLFWRSQLLIASDYVDLPAHGTVLHKIQAGQNIGQDN